MRQIPDDTPLLRQWKLLSTLGSRHHGMTVQEMSDEMCVSLKTIRRDLDMFRQLGFPLRETVEQFGRKKWNVSSDWQDARKHLTFDEAIALYLARQLLKPLAGTPFWRSAQNAFGKIRASFSDAVIKYLESMSTRLHHTTTGSGNYAEKEELIDQIMIGIEDSRAVFITYQSQRATEPVTYDVHPFGITHHFGSLYLVGHKPDDDELRTWKIDRITDAEVTPVPFQSPENFDLSEFHASSFGVYHGDDAIKAKIRFSSTVARYVRESRWHTSQQFTNEKDGSLLAEFELSSSVELKSWILSFGRHAEVLEPEELREEIAQELESTMALYADITRK